MKRKRYYIAWPDRFDYALGHVVAGFIIAAVYGIAWMIVEWIK